MARARPGAFHYDLQGGAIWWSDAVAEAFGRAPGFSPRDPEHYLSLVHDEDRDAARERLQFALKTQGGFDASERVLWPDGSVATIRCRVNVEPGPSGNPSSLSGTTELVEVRPAVAPSHPTRTYEADEAVPMRVDDAVERGQLLVLLDRAIERLERGEEVDGVIRELRLRLGNDGRPGYASAAPARAPLTKAR